MPPICRLRKNKPVNVTLHASKCFKFLVEIIHSFFSVKAIKATQVNVAVQNTNLHGRIYISEVWDEVKEVRQEAKVSLQYGFSSSVHLEANV